MVEPVRPVTISANNSVDNVSFTHTQQFQEYFYRWKALQVAAGGVIERSNGNGVADTNDNITQASHVTLGASGTGAWYVIRFDNLGGGVVRVLWYVNDSSDPRQIMEHRAGPATWAGGTTSALPTPTGFAYAAVSHTLHPFTDLRNTHWSSWRTTNESGAQSIRFLVKETGQGVESTNVHFIAIEGNTDADGGGIGAQRWFITRHQTMTSASFVAASNFFGVDASGVALTNISVEGALWRFSTVWTSGQNINSRQNNQVPLTAVNAAAGRVMGEWVDFFQIPILAGLGLYSDSSESAQAQRRINIGDCSMFWPTGVALS